MQFRSNFSERDERYIQNMMRWTPKYISRGKIARNAKVNQIAKNFVDKYGLGRLGAGDGYVSRRNKDKFAEDKYYSPAEILPVDPNIMHQDTVSVTGSSGFSGFAGIPTLLKFSPVLIIGVVGLILYLKGR